MEAPTPYFIGTNLKEAMTPYLVSPCLLEISFTGTDLKEAMTPYLTPTCLLEISFS